MKRGFTLIELLIVVLIIGILAAIALPQYTKAIERSRIAEAMQVLGDLGTAQSIYYMQSGTFLDSSLTKGDISFPRSLSKSFTVTVGNGTGIAQAKRMGGMYDGGILQLQVAANGAITKTCKNPTKVSDATGFCKLAETAGYGVDSSLGDLTAAPEQVSEHAAPKGEAGIDEDEEDTSDPGEW